MGLLSLTSAGVGLSANITGAASLTQLSLKIRMRTDGILSLASGATFFQQGICSMDSDNAGTNGKFEIYFDNDGSHNIRCNVQGIGKGFTRTPFLLNTAYPTAGNFIEIYLGWLSTAPVITVFDASGTILTDGTNSATGTAGNLGTLAVPGTNGRFNLNQSITANAAVTNIYDGIYLYSSSSLAGNAQWQNGNTGDANLVAAWKLDDVGSPSTAAAAFGGQGLVLTAGQFSWIGGGAWDIPQAFPPPRQPKVVRFNAINRSHNW